jgi:hypothetical protein
VAQPAEQDRPAHHQSNSDLSRGRPLADGHGEDAHATGSIVMSTMAMILTRSLAGSQLGLEIRC